MLTTFNCGLGFLLVVANDQADEAMTVLQQAGEQPIQIGHIVSDDTEVSSGQILIK